MICDCEDWAENIEKVDEARSILTARSGGSYKYSGKTFTHCPWCGDELHSDPEEVWAVRNETASGAEAK